jgi:hypothetical protein
MRISMSGLGQDLASALADQMNAASCVVGAIDPVSGDTIASCPGVNSSTPALVPIVQNGVTVGYSPSGTLPTSSSSTGLYLGIAAVALVVFMAMGRR